jgi:mannitol-1-phosphate 5-dehydrogenase
MKKAVMYGAGNIGRGFIGELFYSSGYSVTFVDVAEKVVNTLHEKHCYPIRIISGAVYEDMMISNVDAINGSDKDGVADAISEADIMATAVGVNVLKFIVPNIAAGLKKRFAESDKPLNIIICENLMDANKVLEGMLKEKLTEEECRIFDERVGLVEASIGSMPHVMDIEFTFNVEIKWRKGHHILYIRYLPFQCFPVKMNRLISYALYIKGIDMGGSV